jgi:hypothetical protein
MSLQWFSFLLIFLVACNNNDQQSGAQTQDDLNTARNFIMNSLNGNLSNARDLLLDDSLNTQYFDSYERTYERMDPDTKRNYREASIIIHELKPVNDSTTIVVYSNSYKKDTSTIKVVRLNGQWKVDFKYLFQQPGDSTAQPVKDKPDIIQ